MILFWTNLQPVVRAIKDEKIRHKRKRETWRKAGARNKAATSWGALSRAGYPGDSPSWGGATFTKSGIVSRNKATSPKFDARSFARLCACTQTQARFLGLGTTSDHVSARLPQTFGTLNYEREHALFLLISHACVKSPETSQWAVWHVRARRRYKDGASTSELTTSGPQDRTVQRLTSAYQKLYLEVETLSETRRNDNNPRVDQIRRLFSVGAICAHPPTCSFFLSTRLTNTTPPPFLPYRRMRSSECRLPTRTKCD